MTHTKKRGRPPVTKPTKEQLRPSVLAFCRRELIALVVAPQGGAWTEREAAEAAERVDLFIEAIQRLPLLRAWKEQDALRAVYRKLLEALEAYDREGRGLVDSNAFEEASLFLQRVSEDHEGVDSPYRVHLERMRPHLDALASEVERMRGILADDRQGKYSPDSERSYFLDLSYDESTGRHLDPLGIGRPLTLRELAMASLLAGQWPAVGGREVTIDAVIRAEQARLRLLAKSKKVRMRWANVGEKGQIGGPTLGEPNPPGLMAANPGKNEGGDLCGRYDFACCRFFQNRMGATPLVMRINTAPLSAEEKEVLRRLVAPRGARRAAINLGVSREVVVSALGGLNLRRGSLALLHAALAPHLAASPSPSAAA